RPAEVVAAAEDLRVDRPLVDAVDEDRDAHRPLGLAFAPRFLPEAGHGLLALAEGLRGGAGRVPAVAEPRDVTERAFAAAADPDRWSWLLERHGGDLKAGQPMARGLDLRP